MYAGKETTPLDSQDELSVLRALVAEQAAKFEQQEAEVSKRDSIIWLLRVQLELLRHRQHGASSEKIEQFELMLEEIEAARVEAEMRSGKAPLPELDDAPANRCPMVFQPKNWTMRHPAIVRPAVAHRS